MALRVSLLHLLSLRLPDWANTKAPYAKGLHPYNAGKGGKVNNIGEDYEICHNGDLTPCPLSDFGEGVERACGACRARLRR